MSYSFPSGKYTIVNNHQFISFSRHWPSQLRTCAQWLFIDRAKRCPVSWRHRGPVCLYISTVELIFQIYIKFGMSFLKMLTKRLVCRDLNLSVYFKMAAITAQVVLTRNLTDRHFFKMAIALVDLSRSSYSASERDIATVYITSSFKKNSRKHNIYILMGDLNNYLN